MSFDIKEVIKESFDDFLGETSVLCIMADYVLNQDVVSYYDDTEVLGKYITEHLYRSWWHEAPKEWLAYDTPTVDLRQVIDQETTHTPTVIIIHAAIYGEFYHQWDNTIEELENEGISVYTTTKEVSKNEHEFEQIIAKEFQKRTGLILPKKYQKKRED